MRGEISTPSFGFVKRLYSCYFRAGAHVAASYALPAVAYRYNLLTRYSNKNISFDSC